MSASHKPADGYSTIMPANALERQLALEYEMNLFDMSVDYDIQEYNTLQKDIKETKKVALIKLITFPIEFIAAFLLLPKHFHKTKFKEMKLWVNFLLNRLSYDNFNRERNELVIKRIK